MNTQSVSIITDSQKARKETRLIEIKPLEFTARLARWSVAGTVALAVIIAGTWAATTPAIAQYLSALLWGTGLLFFAIAFEVNIKRVMPVIMTGLVLPVFAVLGSRVAEEFSILAVIVVATWLAGWIGRQR